MGPVYVFENVYGKNKILLYEVLVYFLTSNVHKTDKRQHILYFFKEKRKGKITNTRVPHLSDGSVICQKPTFTFEPQPEKNK